jgi:tetratricopeptide (TPR) repeat protein
LSRTKKKEFIFATVISLVGLIGACLLVEGYFVFKNWNRSVTFGAQFNSQLGWANIPNQSFTANERTYTTNSFGLRSEPLNPSANHILVLGDSVAYGAGVNDNETMPFYLDLKFPNDQVLNLAVSGYGIGQYFLALKNIIDKTRPKLIIAMIYTGNDFSDTRKDNLFGISKPLFESQNGVLVNLNPSISRFSCQNMISRSWINSLMPTVKLQNYFCSSRELDSSTTKLTIKKLFQEIYVAGKDKNAETIFALSPSLIGSQWLNCYWQGKPDNCHNLDSGFHQKYREVKELLEESELPFVDLNNSFLLKAKGSKSELTTLYNQKGKDIHHYSPKGNRLVAEILADFIDKDLNNLISKGEVNFLSAEVNKNTKIAFDHIKNGNSQKSLELIEKIIYQNPNQPELYLLLGLSYQGLIKYPEALKAFRKAIQLNPFSFESHNLMGLVYYKIGKELEAIASFKNALKIMPDFADTHFNLALALDKIGKGNSALTHMKISKELYRRNKNGMMAGLADREITTYTNKYKIITSKLEEKDISDRLSNLAQIKNLERLLTHYPNDLGRRYKLAQKYLDTDQTELAQTELENILKIYPIGARMWNDLGFLQMKLNRFGEASEKLKKALEINPDFANAHFNLATTMEKLGEKEKAVFHFKKALGFYRQFNNKSFAQFSEQALNRLSKHNSPIPN